MFQDFGAPPLNLRMANSIGFQVTFFAAPVCARPAGGRIAAASKRQAMRSGREVIAGFIRRTRNQFTLRPPGQQAPGEPESRRAGIMRAMIFPVELVVRVYRTLRRVFPRCGMISQAIAFNLFLAFFPFLLIAVGLAASPAGGRVGLMDLISDFTAVLPPGSRQFVQEYLVKGGPQAWKWALLGWSGTLLAGSQVMKLIMEGIHTIYGDSEPMGYLHKQFRGLLLLLVTIAPMLAAAILGILGRPLRGWLAQEYGHRALLEATWTVLFPLAAIVLGIIAQIGRA